MFQAEGLENDEPTRFVGFRGRWFNTRGDE